MWRDGHGAGGRRRGPVGQTSAHRPGGVEREVRAVVPRWCSARSSAPWRGAALGCVGAAEACGFESMGAVVPRWCSARSGALALGCAGAAKACGLEPMGVPRPGGWGVGRTSPGGWSGRSNWLGRAIRPGFLRRWIGQGPQQGRCLCPLRLQGVRGQGVPRALGGGGHPSAKPP